MIDRERLEIKGLVKDIRKTHECKNDSINITTMELENKMQNKSVAVINQIVDDAKSLSIR